MICCISVGSVSRISRYNRQHNVWPGVEWAVCEGDDITGRQVVGGGACEYTSMCNSRNTGFVLSMDYLEKFGIQLSVFKVMNSMKFGFAVWRSMDFFEFLEIFSGGAKLLYASIFFMQFDDKFILILR